MNFALEIQIKERGMSTFWIDSSNPADSVRFRRVVDSVPSRIPGDSTSKIRIHSCLFIFLFCSKTIKCHILNYLPVFFFLSGLGYIHRFYTSPFPGFLVSRLLRLQASSSPGFFVSRPLRHQASSSPGFFVPRLLLLQTISSPGFASPFKSPSLSPCSDVAGGRFAGKVRQPWLRGDMSCIPRAPSAGCVLPRQGGNF